MPAQVEIQDAPDVKPLSPDTIARERAAATAKMAQGDIPDAPMDGATNDVIGHPSDSFNTMASKLEAEIKKVMTKKDVQADRSTAPDASDKKVTDSKTKKPDDNAEAAAAPAADDTPEPPNFTGAKAADWKALKDKGLKAEAQAKEWEQKASIVQKEYEEYRKKAADPTQFELTKKQMAELQAERDKLDAKLKEVDLEKSESFSGFYKKAFDEAIGLAKDAVGKDLSEQIENLLNLPPSKWRKERINEIREELVGSDQGQLDIAIRDFDKARNDKDAQLKDAKTNHAKLQEMEQARIADQRKAAEIRSEAALNAVLDVARNTMESFKRGDDKEHNAFVDEAEAFATKFFRRQLNDTEQALLPILAMEARRYSAKVVPELQKKVKELEAALKEYKGASPNTSGGGGAESRIVQQGDGFIEKFNKLWPAGNR